jgi:hypothetical protein
LIIFLPQIIKQLGVSNVMTGFVTAVPYLIGTIGMIICNHTTDVMNERHHSVRPMSAGGICTSPRVAFDCQLVFPRGGSANRSVRLTD